MFFVPMAQAGTHVECSGGPVHGAAPACPCKALVSPGLRLSLLHLVTQSNTKIWSLHGFLAPGKGGPTQDLRQSAADSAFVS